MSSYKVRVTKSGGGGTIWFESSPVLSESRNAQYANYDIVHLPADVYSYKNTGGRKFSLQGKLISRNVKEANSNAGYLNLARQWLLPTFGQGPGIPGSTPPILKLYAYNNNNIKGVHVILKSYSFNFPDDIDYIYEGSEPMPVIGTLALELDEAYSAEQIRSGAWKIDGGDNGRAVDNGGSGESSSSEFSFDNSPSNSISTSSNLSSKFFNKTLDKTTNIDKNISSSDVIEDISGSGAFINNNPMITNIRPENVLGGIPTILDQQTGLNFNGIIDNGGIINAFNRIDNFATDKFPKIT